MLKEREGTCYTCCSMYAVNVDRTLTRSNLICTRHTHYHLYHVHYTYVYSFKFILYIVHCLTNYLQLYMRQLNMHLHSLNWPYFWKKNCSITQSNVTRYKIHDEYIYSLSHTPTRISIITHTLARTHSRVHTLARTHSREYTLARTHTRADTRTDTYTM